MQDTGLNRDRKHLLDRIASAGDKAIINFAFSAHANNIDAFAFFAANYFPEELAWGTRHGLAYATYQSRSSEVVTIRNNMLKENQNTVPEIKGEVESERLNRDNIRFVTTPTYGLQKLSEDRTISLKSQLPDYST